VRFEQLMAGQIQAATLPDPLAQGATAGGANAVVDDGQYTQFSQSVLSFSTGAIESKPNTIKKFLQAWNRAVQDLNSNPDQFSDLLIEKREGASAGEYSGGLPDAALPGRRGA
jgi:NitT/TauT family transport system substrate-binding protein